MKSSKIRYYRILNQFKNSNTMMINSLSITFRTIWPISPKFLTIIIVLSFLEALSPVFTVFLSKGLYDQLFHLLQQEPVNSEMIYFYLFSQFLVIVSTNLIRTYLNILNLKVQNEVNFIINEKIIRKTTSVPLITIETPEYQDKLQRANTGMAGRGLDQINVGISIIKNIITLSSFAIILFNSSSLLVFGIILLVLPSLVQGLHTGKKKYLLYNEQTPDNRKLSYLSSILLGKDTAKEIKIFGHLDYLIQKWKELFWKNTKSQFENNKYSNILNFKVEFFNITGSYILLGFMVYLVTKGEMDLSSFVVISQIMSTMKEMLKNVFYNLTKIVENSLYINDFVAFMNTKEENTGLKTRTFDRLKKEIFVDNITFSYPSREGNVLNNVTFKINVGEKIAIVGENGSGKSTLAKCLIGLYSVNHGEILYDGIDLERLSIDSFRRNISVVFQDFVRYSLTFKENIGIGNIENINDLEKIKNASKFIGATDALKFLKNGYETIIGSVFFGGQELSGGQWQKIALSRAALRNSNLIVLDEPTSSLDPIIEVDILKKFIDMSKEKTSIIITHRLGCCKFVDKVIVLKEGKLVEVGSHEELIKKSGYYNEMYTAQSEWYN